MRIQKGMKLTPEQKAQRAESRRRNDAEWLKRSEASHKREMALIRAGYYLIPVDRRPPIEEFLRTAHHGPAQWFNLQLTQTEREALAWIQKETAPHVPACSPGDAARFVLQHALAHPGAVVAMIRAFQQYRDAEGFNGGGQGNELALARIAQRPEYACAANKPTDAQA